MECHVSQSKPLKKRHVRPFLSLMHQATDHLLDPDQSSTPVHTTPASPDADNHLKQQVSQVSSRRSSDSGIVSPATRTTTDPSDSESAPPITDSSEARTPNPGKVQNGQTAAKRTPFCGRCRNHWPDNPVLVKGQYLLLSLLLSSLTDTWCHRSQEDVSDERLHVQHVSIDTEATTSDGDSGQSEAIAGQQ